MALFLLFLTLFYTSIVDAAHIAISHKCSVRLASIEDLKAIIELDVRISDEYFKPLILQYPEFEGKEQDVEKILADEVESDTAWFTSCIAMEKQQRLYIAYNETIPIGFVACHEQDNTMVVIDLLMIDVNCRGKGIGKQLIQTCIQAFPEAFTCMLIVLDKNKQARTVYEKIGFVLMNEKPAFVQEKYPQSRFLCYSLSLESI